MKVKAVEFQRVEKELDLEYPIYLSFQGEDCTSEEHVKMWHNYSIHVNWDYMEFSIARKPTANYQDYVILNNLSTEEEFNTQYDYAEEWLRNRKNGE